MTSSSPVRKFGARLFVTALLTGALLTGGASLEGEFAQSVFFACCAVVTALFFLASEPWWKGPVISVFGFIFALLALCCAQVMPLPPEYTAEFPMRSVIFSDLASLGTAYDRFALSLAPESSLAGFIAFLAPIAGFVTIAALRWNRGASFLKWLIPLLGASSALLGISQVVLGDSPDLYLYESTTRGVPSGFFANPNHQASFLLMCLPFVAVLVSDLRQEWEARDDQTALAILYAVVSLIILAGILGAGSVAGYVMLPLVLGLALPILLHDSAPEAERKTSVFGLIAVPVVVALAAVMVFTSPRLGRIGSTSFEDTPSSRIGIARVSLDILEDHWLAGTGLGSFDEVYHSYEDPALVERVYIAHAHNDYVEWLIETGVAGGILLAAFLLWFAFHAMRVWGKPKVRSLVLRRAASVSCVVPLVHSLADYPLRTPAISMLAAMCLAVIVVPSLRPAPVVKTEAAPLEEIKIVEI